MNEQTQPTDAELIDVWAQFVGDPTPKLPLTDADKVAFARAVLAKWGTPAGAGEVVAWLVPHLHTFKGATKVHFTRAPGCTMTNVELMEDLEGRVMWLPSTFSDSPGVTDKFGVHHKPKPLFTTPQPNVAQAGAVPLATYRAYALIDSMGWALDDQEKDDMLRLLRATEAAHGITAHGVADMEGGHDVDA